MVPSSLWWLNAKSKTPDNTHCTEAEDVVLYQTRDFEDEDVVLYQTRDFEDAYTSKWMAVFTMTVYITIYDIQITIQKVITYRC